MTEVNTPEEQAVAMIEGDLTRFLQDLSGHPVNLGDKFGETLSRDSRGHTAAVDRLGNFFRREYGVGIDVFSNDDLTIRETARVIYDAVNVHGLEGEDGAESM